MPPDHHGPRGRPSSDRAGAPTAPAFARAVAPVALVVGLVGGAVAGPGLVPAASASSPSSAPAAAGPAATPGRPVAGPDAVVVPAGLAVERGRAQPSGPASGLPEPEPTAEEARQAADEILARGEYQEPPKTLLERVSEWAVEQLGKLFSSFTGGSGGALAWVILAVLVGVAIFLLSRVRAGVFARRPREGEALFETSVEARRSPSEWLREAEQLEASGAWKEGLRARYRALVGTLILEQLLRDIPGRTTGEYRLELRRAAPHLAPDFQAATDLFERAWYGDEPTGPTESERFRTLATHLDARLREPVAATAAPSGPVAPS